MSRWSRHPMIHDGEEQVQELLPELPRPEQHALALLVDGVVVSGQTTLRAASAATPGAAQDGSKQRRAQRLLANPRLDVNRAQRRFVARVLSRCHGRVDLLLDATTTGATATSGGTVTRCVSRWRSSDAPCRWSGAPGRRRDPDRTGQDWTGLGRRRYARWRCCCRRRCRLTPGGGAGGSRPLGALRPALAGVGLAFSAPCHPPDPGTLGRGADLRAGRGRAGADAGESLLPLRRHPLRAPAQTAGRRGRVADRLDGRRDAASGRRLAARGRGGLAPVSRSARDVGALSRVSAAHLGGGTLSRSQAHGLAVAAESGASAVAPNGWRGSSWFLALATLWMLALARRVMRRGGAPWWRPAPARL